MTEPVSEMFTFACADCHTSVTAKKQRFGKPRKYCAGCAELRILKNRRAYFQRLLDDTDKKLAARGVTGGGYR